jgi:hypothetical protein
MEAASEGRLEVLQWLLQQGCELTDLERSMMGAAEKGMQLSLTPISFLLLRFFPHFDSGQLHVLKWLRSELQLPFAPRHNLCTCAARGGQLEVLQWLRAEGCPWNESDVARESAGSGKLQLQWAV